MQYVTVKQTARKWGLSERRVRTLCREGRIDGVFRMGWIWSIPEDAAKPADARARRRRLKTREETGLGKMRFGSIDSKKMQLDRARPLPKHTLKSLQESTLVEWTYNSNAIEGNTLTMSETRVVLEGVTVGGKSVREHLEVINHKDAILYLEELAHADEPLTEWSIKNLHRLVLKNIDTENAGVYRHENVLISGAKHRPPEHFLIKDQMESMIARHGGEWQRLHPVERAALLHIELARIHPFIDGNGRTARLLMNFELLKFGFPPAIIKAETRPQYYDALDKAHTTGDCSTLVALVAICVEQALDLWLSVV